MFAPPAMQRQDSGSGNTPGLVSMVVDEALHEGFGPAKHTTYRLTTTLVKTSSTSTCRKRFSHFIALRATMVESSPGLVIPPLPEKSVMNRFESDFVENRRLMLEVFLQRVVNHPVAVLLPALAQFLGWKEDICTIINAEMGSFTLPQPQARRPQPNPGPSAERPHPTPGVRPAALAPQSTRARTLSRRRSMAAIPSRVSSSWPSTWSSASSRCAPCSSGTKPKPKPHLNPHPSQVRTVLKRMNAKQQETGMDYLEMAQSVQALGDNSMNITLRSAASCDPTPPALRPSPPPPLRPSAPPPLSASALPFRRASALAYLCVPAPPCTGRRSWPSLRDRTSWQASSMT